ncbi:hypothetical protein C438_18120 [Haloferax denitrificans ATCC 35960]|uniref:Uncharacterized protein n=4 Tax=Haloferacaceae TaxID=1644056 RepID=M0IC73_9EURY|nr:hypothetical protein C441_09056 [Haloferax sulfurifontis ATCC BAA-897]EMA00397.1 hypothetical protein C438_18120 [Haloferax denitrificans ATCC 35960]GGC61270.1 hypothetical protein GCM10007209_24220 [Haloferax sulfurifontis]
MMTDDPFSLAVPEGWTVETDVDTDEASAKTVYESPDSDRRVTITEFARGLTLYWWVDIFALADGEWHRREVGLGDSYRDADAVSDAAQEALDRLASSGERIESIADD